MSRSKVNWMVDWAAAWGLAPENWSPYVGCTKCSPGCDNCWAERLEETRLKRLDRCNGRPFSAGPAWQGIKADTAPIRWTKPRLVWCCPSSDPFHEDVYDGSMEITFGFFALRPQHQFVILTKRAERAHEYMDCRAKFGRTVPNNLSLGVTVCNQKEWNEKVPMLLDTPAAMRFVSVEPMLGPVDIEPIPEGIDWIILGCESGAGRRTCKADWMTRVVLQCEAADIPVYVKQIDIGDRVSHDMAEWPEVLRVREIPERKEDDDE